MTDEPTPHGFDRLDPAPDPPRKAMPRGASPATWIITAALVLVVVLLIVTSR